MPRFRLPITLAAAVLMSANLQGCVTASGIGLHTKDRANAFYTPLPQESEASLPALPPYVKLVRFRSPVTALEAGKTPRQSDPPENHAAEWLFSRNPDRHVIQLVSAREKAGAKRYLEKNHLTGSSHIFYASFPKSGGWWYAVYAQTFSSRRLAEDAAAGLPVAKDSYLVRPAREMVRHQCDNLARLPKDQQESLTGRCAAWKRTNDVNG